jgi:GntR family transcriptional repressor for pyruvate dehydrogenase complex
LRKTIAADPAKLGTEEQFLYNKEFHSVVLDGAGNTLLRIAAQPIFSVLQTHLSREARSPDFAARVHEDHRAILVAIEHGDGAAAATAMHSHLGYLSRTYTDMWRPGEPLDQ